MAPAPDRSLLSDAHWALSNGLATAPVAAAVVADAPALVVEGAAVEAGALVVVGEVVEFPQAARTMAAAPRARKALLT